MRWDLVIVNGTRISGPTCYHDGNVTIKYLPALSGWYALSYTKMHERKLDEHINDITRKSSLKLMFQFRAA